MGLVHRHKGDRRIGRQIEETVGEQTLRGNIENFVCAVQRLAKHRHILAFRQGGVEAGRRHAFLLQRSHLIFHE